MLARCGSTVPLQVLAPVALDDPACVLFVVNPTGGLVGGDRLAVDVTVGARAHACLTTPSVSKVYRTLGAPAVQEVRLGVGEDAILEWVPDHTIPFAGSAFRQRITAEIAAGGRLILVDAFAAGRVARDETWRFARLESALELRDARGWLLVDRFALEGSRAWDELGFAESSRYVATVVVAGASGAGEEGVARGVSEALAPLADVRAGVAPLPRGGAIVRCLAPTAPALTAAIDAAWAAARREALGLPPLALRKS